MINFVVIMLTILILSTIMMSANIILSKKLIKNREKASPFECGFDPMVNTRLPFSIHFFLISLIFLIFDIEITLLIPMIQMSAKFNKIMVMSCFLFIIILIIGLYTEYLEESMDWKF